MLSPPPPPQVCAAVCLDVVIEVCDGAAPQRKRQRERCTYPPGPDEFKVAYINPYTGSLVFIVSDPPHLIKKGRNNLEKSRKKEGGTRWMAFNGQLIVWDFVELFFEEDSRRGVRVLHKLRPRHVYPNSEW